MKTSPLCAGDSPFLTGRATAQLPSLDFSTMDQYRNAIEPTAEETAFLKIDWRSQLQDAVARAYESDKPLLIYVMNGHPLGCTGAKLTATLLHEMGRRKLRYGMVSMCIGGGMGAAGIFERIES